MTKVKILDIKERTRWLAPDKPETTLEVLYETENKFRGTVKGLPSVSTEEEVWAAVRKAAKVPEGLIGKEEKL